MITKLIIENFKGFGDKPQSIEFAPITLLFGANSAGKSSIFHALFFLRELFATGIGTPEAMSYFSDRVELGGFGNTVHGKVADRDIRLTICLDPTATLDDEYSLGDSSIKLEITISPVDQTRGYVRRFRLFQEENLLFACEGTWNPKKRFFDVSLSFGYRELFEFCSDISPPDDTVSPWSTFYGSPGVMPKTYDPILSQGCRRNDKLLSDDEKLFVIEVDKLIMAAMKFASKSLDDMLYIGPVRKIPPADYSAQANPPKSRWASGIAAWDKLHFCDAPELDRLNEILEKDGELGLCSGITINRQLLVPFPRDNSMLQVSELTSRIRICPATSAGEPSKSPVYLRVQDVGFGISQLVPIVASLCLADERLILVEQPEIHLHPRLQTALGDLLIAACIENSPCFSDSDRYPKRCILETHSEHLMLRILRRIRESSNGKTFGRLPSISCDDIAVNYVDVARGQTVVTRLRINEQGEFMDRWPRGFFAERMEELF
jgi:hypothetical protein